MNFLFWLLIKIFLLGGDAGDFDSWGDRGGSGIIKYVNYTKVKKGLLRVSKDTTANCRGCLRIERKGPGSHSKENSGFYTHTHCTCLTCCPSGSLKASSSYLAPAPWRDKLCQTSSPFRILQWTSSPWSNRL